MFRLLENRSDGGWVFWVCQRADGNADQRGYIVGSPVDGRAAVWTKIGMDFPAACGGACVLFWGSGDDDDLSGIECAHTERRAGSPLALDAVTGDDQPGCFGKRERDGDAAAS